MRPRERERDQTPPESSPTPSTPPPRPAKNLSSMVVGPSDTAGGDFEPGDLDHCVNSPATNPHRRDSPAPWDLHRRRGKSPPPFLRRGDSPVGFRRRNSPPAFRRRGGGGGGWPPPFHRHSRSQRFHVNSGSISPPSRRPRFDDSHCVTKFDHPTAPRFGRDQGGRGGGRFRDVSPHYSLGRGSRSYGRGYNVDQRGTSPLDGEYVHRNDPNLSPREGDWICGNPRCGNLNFARRTYCNNCDEPRVATGRPGPIRSPRRGYFASPPLRGSPLSTGGPLVDRDRRRNFSGYRSPPRGWVTEDPREFGTGSPPPSRRGGRFQDNICRDSRLAYEDEYRGRGNWPVDEEWVRRDGFLPERRGYDQRPSSPLPPRDQWVRERSRSPVGSRPLKRPYIGHGRDDRHRNYPYMGRGRTDDSEVVRGRGFRRTEGSFMGRGKGDRRTEGSFMGRGKGDHRDIARGRNNNGLY